MVQVLMMQEDLILQAIVNRVHLMYLHITVEVPLKEEAAAAVPTALHVQVHNLHIRDHLHQVIAALHLATPEDPAALQALLQAVLRLVVVHHIHRQVPVLQAEVHRVPVQVQVQVQVQVRVLVLVLAHLVEDNKEMV